MCTVSYLPLGQNRFILTSNRDEAPDRSPVALTREEDHGLMFPRDTLAGGTWLCASDQNRLICILNGAFEKHKRQLPYRRSRGLVALDHFTFPDAESFFRDYDLREIEPFTMVVFDNGRLWELRWDHEQKHIKSLSPDQPHFWSSATLYPADIAAERRTWFDQWLDTKPEFTVENIMHFHATGGKGDIWNDLVMNRDNIVRTVSITGVLKEEHSIAIRYRDILRDTIATDQIAIQK